MVKIESCVIYKVFPIYIRGTTAVYLGMGMEQGQLAGKYFSLLGQFDVLGKWFLEFFIFE